jgi:hypothetical protein
LSTPYVLPVARPFRPRYLLPSELVTYGLPDPSVQPNILALVDAASTFIDEYCGRTDGNGQGSLVYTTYQERILLQARNRNIFRLTFKPLAVITPTTQALLIASANQVQGNDPLEAVNWYYTGFQANTIVRPDGTTTSILGASGRYGYPRRGEAAIYPDLNYGMNLLQVAAFFGGPPQFTFIDPTAIDFDTATAEVWVPAGLYMSQYTEVVITYNSGYSPVPIPGVMQIPQAIKQACVGLIKNFLSRAGGTFGIKSISVAGGVNYTFGDFQPDQYVDPTIERYLMNYKTIVAY